MNNITLKKISEVLGLSISTISRGLKGHPDISEKTKQKIIELANTLDYEPNANAINLRTSKSNLFGVIVPSISNLFYESFIASLEEECRKNNYSLMTLQSCDDPAIEIMNIKLCRQNRISGLFASISSTTNNIDAFLKLNEVDVPVIFFDKVPEAENCNKICFDDSTSAIIAAKEIIAKKKKKVLALFGNKNLSITKKRYQAFFETINEKKNKIKVTTEHCNDSNEAEKITAKHLENKYDLIFCMSDEILIGAMKSVQKSKIHIPEDISIISLSNGFIPTLYYPQITYVETSGYSLGKLAFSSMQQCIKGETETTELLIDAKLIKGGSM